MSKEAQEAERRLLKEHPPDVSLSPKELEQIREAGRRYRRLAEEAIGLLAEAEKSEGWTTPNDFLRRARDVFTDSGLSPGDE